MISFKGRHHQQDIILQCVRWYVAYALSYRDLEELMQERGYAVDHSTVQRWVVHYAPRIEKAFRKNKKRTGNRWRLDETYIKIKGEWKYLYRAVDKQGDTIDFLLTAKRDKKAARRFLNKAIGSSGKPSLINIDKSGANTAAIKQYNRDESKRVKIRQCKYLQHCRARSSLYQAANSTYAGLQILLVGTGDLGRNRTLAHAEEGSKQEFAAGMGAVLRPGPDRIVAPDGYS